MTSKEFIIWLKGYIEGIKSCHTLPENWFSVLLDKIETITDLTEKIEFKIEKIIEKEIVPVIPRYPSPLQYPIVTMYGCNPVSDHVTYSIKQSTDEK